MSKTLHRTINKVIGRTMMIKMETTVERKDKRWMTLYTVPYELRQVVCTRIIFPYWAKIMLKQCTASSRARGSVDSSSSFSMREGSSALVYLSGALRLSVAIFLP